MATRGVLTSRLRAGVGLASLALVCLVPGTARADSSLVLSPADFSTLHLRPVAERVDTALGKVAAGLATSARQLLSKAEVEASGATARGHRWSSDAFVLGSVSAARQVLADWRRVHHAGRVKVGGGGAAHVRRSHGRVVVQVLWRDGTRLGLIVLSATRDLSGARAHALSYAALADSYLKTPLPRTAWAKVMAQVRPNGTVSEQTSFGAPETLPTHGDVEFPQIAVNAQGFGWATWTNDSSPSAAFALPITPAARGAG